MDYMADSRSGGEKVAFEQTKPVPAETLAAGLRWLSFVIELNPIAACELVDSVAGFILINNMQAGRGTGWRLVS
jgi:hypothetical protein